MTSGWTGTQYDGIPAGHVTELYTMQPTPSPLAPGMSAPPPLLGLDYFMRRGITANVGGYSIEALSSVPPVVSPGCNSQICKKGSVPVNSKCRTLG
jgi:hypothetical protein